tara:strand:- start:4142 stop:4852 length:711 start_codon:yes stop_codon:yes gene_type:complete
MKIFNSDTRSVILNHEKAYKFFNSRSECEEEVKRLKKSPISEVYDEISNYKMKIVKILEVKEYFYSMDQAKGEKLEINHNYKDFYLAGRWLRCFHDLTYNNDIKKVFIFGDFIAPHLFIDHNNKEINTIDPGNNFGLIDEIEIDISRFFVNLLLSRNFNINRLKNILANFFNGYGLEKINYFKLDKAIKFRISRNFEKSIQLKKGIKHYNVSYFFFIFSKIKYLFIKKKLKELLIK